MLQLAKLEKGKLKLTIAKGNLGLFLHTIAESFSYNASAKEIDYTYAIDKIDDVWYDEDAIEKIISNLISNASKYTPEKGYCSFNAYEKDHPYHSFLPEDATPPLDLNQELMEKFRARMERAEKETKK